MTETPIQSSRAHRIITLGIIIGFIFMLGTVGSVGLGKIEQQSRLQARHSLQSVLNATHKTMYVWLEHRLKSLHRVANSEVIIQLTQAQLAYPKEANILKNSDELRAIRNYIGPVMKEYGDLGMFIISPDMISIASMRDANIGSTNIIAQKRPSILSLVFAGEAHFIPPITSDVLLKDHTGRLVKNQPTMFIAAPIKDSNDKVIAALTLRLDPSKDFSKIMQLSRIGETGETYAIDEAGTLISESRFDNQLRASGLLGPNQHAMLTIQVRDPGVNFSLNEPHHVFSQDKPLTQMAQQASSGYAGFNTNGYRDYRGIEVFGAWLWDEDLGFAMATEMDASEALQPFHATRTVIVSIFIFTLVLVTLLLFLLEKVERKNKKNLLLLYSQLEHRVRERTVALEDAKVKLSIANRELQELATIDSLTGLSNRRYLDDFLDKEWNRCMRECRSLSLIMFDIDYFKLYNDHYGHLAGDECLQKIGLMLKSERILSRPGDLIARYGGEEFAIVLSNTNLEDAIFIMNKLMAAINNAALPHQGSLVADCKQVTISAGVACVVPAKPLKPNDLIEQADLALYNAKNNGRNQYQLAPNTGPEKKVDKKK